MKNCFYCNNGIKPNYKDVENLEKFLTTRRKISPRDRSHLCAKCQRGYSKAVKHARFLALLPYNAYQGMVL